MPLPPLREIVIHLEEDVDQSDKGRNVLLLHLILLHNLLFFYIESFFMPSHNKFAGTENLLPRAVIALERSVNLVNYK